MQSLPRPGPAWPAAGKRLVYRHMLMIQAEGNITEDAVDVKSRRRAHTQMARALHVLLHTLQANVVIHFVLVTRQVQPQLRGIVKQLLFLQVRRVLEQ